MTLPLTGAGSAVDAVTLSFTTGLYSWYKADSGTSTTTDGVAISQWDDSSGNARHLVQATGANQPLYKAAILNGKPVVRFDGLTDFLAHAATSVAQPDTIFVVAKQTAIAGSHNVVDGTTTRQAIYSRSDTEGWSLYADGAEQSTLAAPDTNWHVHAAVFNGASSVLYVDGTSKVAANPGAGTLAGLRVGVASTAANFWPGDVAELLIYSGALSNGNRQTVQSYLGSKYGITVV